MFSGLEDHDLAPPTISAPRSRDRTLGDGVTLDRDRRRHDSCACAPVNAFNAEIAENIAEIAEIDVTIIITGIAGINDIKIGRRVMSLIIFGDGRMAEIIIKSTAKPIPADMLVRLLLAHGVTAAKIIRSTQTAKESPLLTVCDLTGGGQST